MLNKWFLVADGSRARIFSGRNDDGHLDEIADLANPSGKAGDSELASYAPGEGARPGPRTATQETSAADHSIQLFSKYVARYLDAARNERQYDKLYLIAPAGFLGCLRMDLSGAVQKLVVNELD